MAIGYSFGGDVILRSIACTNTSSKFACKVDGSESRDLVSILHNVLMQL